MRLAPIPCGPYRLEFRRTLIMGVLNVTPDSFSDGGQFLDPEAAVAQARTMVEDGADIIDIGAESTRPGASAVPAEEELRRLVPVLTRLAADLGVPVSVDTRKPSVAREAFRLGAHILNDVGGLRDPDMICAAAEAGAPVIAMHMRGDPQTMQQNISYDDVVTDSKSYLARQVEAAKSGGVAHVIIDPGLGFGKTVDHNLEILRRLGEFGSLGCPVLVGPSRKSFLGAITGKPSSDRLEATIAAAAAAALNGADIVRVHDVRQCRPAIQVADALRNRKT